MAWMRLRPCSDRVLRELSGSCSVPDVRVSGGDRDVRGRDGRAAEDDRFRRQAVADRLGADVDFAAVAGHTRSAPERAHQQVGHAEVRAHPADVALDERLARESPGEDADVRGGTADVDHQRIFETGQEAGAPHAVGGPGGERQHRVAGDERVAHQRAVVLADEEGGVYVERCECGAEGVDHAAREVREARVQDRGVLALEETEAADGGREGQVRVGEFVADDLGGAGFHGVVDWGEEAGEGDGADVGGFHLAEGVDQGLLVQGVREFARVLVTAADEPASAVHQRRQVGGPVGEGWDGGGGGQRETQDTHRQQALPLQHRVGEVRRADHDRLDAADPDAARGEHGAYRIDDALRDVRGGGRLVRGDDAPVHDHHRVRVRAADVHADSRGHVGEIG